MIAKIAIFLLQFGGTIPIQLHAVGVPVVSTTECAAAYQGIGAVTDR